MIKQLAKDVKDQIAATGSSNLGMSDKTILMKYLQLPKGGKDGLARNADTFYKHVMPNIEQIFKKDRSMTMIQKLEFGQVVNVWQLR